MGRSIYKFERDMLHGEPIHVNRKSDNAWFQMHWHNYYEMIYYRNCVGCCILNGEKYALSDHCLFLLTPKDFHEVVTEESPGAESFIISFSEQIVDRALLGRLTENSIVLYGLSDGLDRSIGELYETFQGTGIYRERLLLHLFNGILIHILEAGKPVSSVSGNINPIVRDSISLMLVNPAGDFSLSFFARKFGVTKTYFSHLFHENTGISFKQYLTTLRMGYARRMLEEKELPIIDVGYECGFNTPSQFIRAFKKATGMTPSAYRAQSSRANPQRGS